MPSTPTSKSQVQAYRFMLRRMESALVRKDAVMLHDPMGSHTRAAAVGVLLAMVASVGFILFAALKPSGSLPADGVVIGKQSGAVYALIKNQAGDQVKLVPTFNVTSARLVLMAQQSGGGGQGGGQQSSASGPPSAANVTVVDDDVLAGYQRDRKTGIVDGPQLLPSTDAQRAPNNWAVCDTVDLQNTPNPLTGKVNTSVIAGVPNVGSEISTNQPLLVTPDKGSTFYLVYRKSQFSKNPAANNANAVKSKVDMSGTTARTYRLNKQDARPVTAAVLNAIPQVDDLTIPTTISRSSTPQYPVNDAKVGDVLHAQDVNHHDQFFVLLPNGKREISQSAGEALIDSPIGSTLREVNKRDLTQVPDDQDPMTLDDFPEVLSTPVAYSGDGSSPTMCMTWSYAKDGRQQTTVTISSNQGTAVPAGKNPIKLSSTSTDGQKVTDFYMPTGTAAVVHGSSREENAGIGAIYVVSDLGVKYGVASSVPTLTPLQVAAGLGLGDPKTYPPAPDAILAVLPNGTALDPGAALKTYDSVTPPSTVGAFPTTATASN